MELSLKSAVGYGCHSGTGMHPGAIRSDFKSSRINSACTEMESLFVQNMFKHMRASIPKGGLTSGGKAEEMFTDMLDAELAKTFSAAGGIGLSRMVQRQLEAAPGTGDAEPRK